MSYIDINATQQALNIFCIPLTAQQRNEGQVRELKMVNKDGILSLTCVTGPKPNFIKRIFSDSLTMKQAAKFCSDNNISNSNFFEVINRYNTANFTGKVPTQVQMRLQKNKMQAALNEAGNENALFVQQNVAGNTWKIGNQLVMLGAKTAIENNCNLILQKLLKANSLSQEQKNQLLLLAAEKNSTSCVKEMLKAGANINTQNDKEWPALMYAAEYGNKDMAELLLSHNAAVDLGPGKFTPLMYCAQRGHTDVAYQLLDAGAGVTQQNDSDRRCALHWAAEKGDLSMVKMLLRQKARPQKDAMDSAGHTPWDIATLKGRHNIISLLQAKGK